MADSTPDEGDINPNIADFIALILDGSLDNELKAIENAINKRKEGLQEEIIARVHDIFGDNYDVVKKGNPFLLKHKGKSTIGTKQTITTEEIESGDITTDKQDTNTEISAPRLRPAPNPDPEAQDKTPSTDDPLITGGSIVSGYGSDPLGPGDIE